MRYKFLREYSAEEADILLWFGQWSIRNLLARIFAGAKFFHVSILSKEPSKGIYYNYEQNMDFLSEKPISLSELLKNSSYKCLVLRPKFEEIKEYLNGKIYLKHKLRGFGKDRSLPERITAIMKEIIWFRYNNIDIFRVLLNKYRKAIKIVDCDIDENGVEILYYFKGQENAMAADKWVLSIDKRNSFTCSGAVAAAFVLTGVQLFDKLPWFVLPDDFAKCKFFEILGYIDSSTEILS